MKKTFKLTDEKKHPDRIIEGIKHELRKYLKRERSKKLPESETMYWDFACRFGQSAEQSEAVEFNAIMEGLDKSRALGWEACYIEILAKAVAKPAKSPKGAETPAAE